MIPFQVLFSSPGIAYRGDCYTQAEADYYVADLKRRGTAMILVLYYGRPKACYTRLSSGAYNSRRW